MRLLGAFLTFTAMFAGSAHCQTAFKDDVPTESVSEGVKTVTSAMKVIPGHSIWLSLYTGPKRIITVAITGSKKNVSYDEVKVLGKDKSGQPLEISPEYADIKRFTSNDVGPGNGYEHFGRYIMKEDDLKHLFSVDITYEGKTLSFKLPAPK
jgi:hypothetical protein